MSNPSNDPALLAEKIRQYSLLDALRNRRSRRFGAGMKMNSGPLAYESRFSPVPLSEDEEAALAFAGALNAPADFIAATFASS
jgi:hypothetical protein